MKQFLLLLLALALSVSAWSQEEDRPFVLGGFVSVNHAINGENPLNETFSAKGTPLLGYYFSEKMMIGCRLGYGYRIQRNTNLSEINSHSLYIAPLLRKRIFHPLKLQPFLEFSLPFSYGFDKRTPSDVKTRNYSIGAYVGVGMEYQLSSRWSANLIWAAYSYSFNRQIDTKRTTHNIGLNANLNSINWGINYHF